MGQPHTIDGTSITSYNVVKDLGVQIDSQLKFHDHTTTITKKANRLLAIIQKTFQHFDKNTVINLYKSYIQPVLEYGNIVWGPQYILDQQNIEKVQRRATKLIHNLQDYTYDDRLVELNLPSLKYQRHCCDMIMIYQLLHNNLNVDNY